MLPESARERPMSGAVVSVGPGKRDKDGSRKSPKVMSVLSLWFACHIRVCMVTYTVQCNVSRAAAGFSEPCIAMTLLASLEVLCCR